MKKIYLILMHTNTFPSKLVKIFTRYMYSHVAISLNRGCDTLYSFGRKRVDSILDGGFIAQQRQGEFFKKFHNTICIIYEIDVTLEQFQAINKIINDMQLNAIKYKYDFIGIVLRFFGIPFVMKNRYVCSYFVADVLEKAQIYKFNKKVCFIKPKDFENIKESKKIYSVLYCSYRVRKNFDEI